MSPMHEHSYFTYIVASRGHTFYIGRVPHVFHSFIVEWVGNHKQTEVSF